MKYAVLASIAIMCFLGCSKVKIDSNLRTGYEKKLSSIYVLCRVAATGSPQFVNELMVALEKKLEPMNVKIKAHMHNQLELNENEKIKSEITAFQPKAILQLVQTSQVIGIGSGVGGATFELSLTEIPEEIPFWKAVLETQSPNGSWSSSIGGYGSQKNIGNVDLTADNIILKLQQDGLISVPPIK